MSEIKHTAFASKAMGMVQLFNLIVADPLDGPVKYKAELAAPDGPSTGGGKQAVQHIKLVPMVGGPTLVAGSANQAAKTAELRTYAYLAQQHAVRFGTAQLTLGQSAYEALVEKLHNFFKTQGLAVTIVDADPTPVTAAPAAAATTGAPNKRWIAIGAAVAVVGVAVAAFLAMR